MDSWSKSYRVELTTHPDTNVVFAEEWFDENGLRDRPGDLPAVVNYDPVSGAVQSQQWFKKGMLHREGDKPASLTWDPTGNFAVEEIYALMDLVHREGDKPAQIFRSNAGSVSYHCFLHSGHLHRETGPAVEYFTEGGVSIQAEKEYWRHGRQTGGNVLAPELTP